MNITTRIKMAILGLGLAIFFAYWAHLEHQYHDKMEFHSPSHRAGDQGAEYKR